MVKPLIGILALQGAFESHAAMLSRLGETSRTVRTAAELDSVDALVLPGGESSAMLRLMQGEDLADRLQKKISAGMPILATCAGVILLASSVEPAQVCLQKINLDVVRNAYGRQLHSSVEGLRLEAVMGEPATCEGVFIRAPRIVRTGKKVEVLGWLGDDPVLVRENHIIAATFHPELSSDLRVHRLFVELLRRG